MLTGGESTEARSVPRAMETMVPGALVWVLVTAQRQTQICDQVSYRTESICQQILGNWICNLHCSFKKLASHVGI